MLMVCGIDPNVWNMKENEVGVLWRFSVLGCCAWRPSQRSAKLFFSSRLRSLRIALLRYEADKHSNRETIKLEPSGVLRQGGAHAEDRVDCR
jgi:hypothetical protein